MTEDRLLERATGSGIGWVPGLSERKLKEVEYSRQAGSCKLLASGHADSPNSRGHNWALSSSFWAALRHARKREREKQGETKRRRLSTRNRDLCFSDSINSLIPVWTVSYKQQPAVGSSDQTRTGFLASLASAGLHASIGVNATGCKSQFDSDGP
ncbi:hypothetical protein LY76DRAFT_607732 [Colletotrichum caudatum]|nr:hypothetical protein LY76DRAFT_607732 [Colletotrichum caudatum]